ncbi:MAG: hypothetical protein HZT41_10055 [Dechloromonas sp.]|nr:MAG: hypothetical protein HZT41_10055 [Dechloromonas sp.]
MSKKATATEALVRVLKNGTCPNLSGKSTLSYRIGVNDAGEIMLQLVGNSNPGCFNNEWVKYADVQELLTKHDQGKAITSYALVPLYRGKSTNSPSFLFAVLKQEGLVQLSASKKRCYDRCSDAAFLASIGKLIEGKPAAVQAPKAKAGKNNKEKVASDAVAQEPAEKPLDVPDSKPSPEVAKRGRPKKAQPMVDAVVPQAEQAETS